MSGLGSFLSGAVTLAYLVGALFFVRFWRKSGDRLFLMFSIAFALLSLNQLLAFALEVISEPYSFVYGIRVLAFALIIVAIVEKNLAARR
jgi:hypothetical protein